MKTALDPRHLKRETTVKNLYAQSFHKQPLHDARTTTILENLATIDKIITGIAPEFPIDKINRVDLAILRLAVYELTIEKTEPPKVIIDEAIELAKDFGSDNTPGFVNGSLGKLVNESSVKDKA